LSRRPIAWTDEMIATLRDMRERGYSMERCAGEKKCQGCALMNVQLAVDDIIRRVKHNAKYRTRYVGQEQPWDERLVEEIERLRNLLVEANDQLKYKNVQILEKIYTLIYNSEPLTCDDIAWAKREIEKIESDQNAG